MLFFLHSLHRLPSHRRQCPLRPRDQCGKVLALKRRSFPFLVSGIQGVVAVPSSRLPFVEHGYQ